MIVVVVQTVVVTVAVTVVVTVVVAVVVTVAVVQTVVVIVVVTVVVTVVVIVMEDGGSHRGRGHAAIGPLASDPGMIAMVTGVEMTVEKKIVTATDHVNHVSVIVPETTKSTAWRGPTRGEGK